jgi:hypothetical protein
MMVVKSAAVDDMRPLIADDLAVFTAAVKAKFADAVCHAG